MAYSVSSSRRQIVMAVLLALAMAGAVIRHQAPNPSTLRDVGSLLLVLWIPAVGNLIGFLARKLPRSAPPPTHFQAGSTFTPQLRAELTLLPLPEGLLATLDQLDDRATLITGRRGFTVRLEQPVAQWLVGPPHSTVALECLLPDVARRTLVAGTPVHLLLGATAVAKGQVVADAQAS